MQASGKATWFDGRSSRRREVEVRLTATIDLVEDGAVAERWRYDDLRRLDSPPGLHRYRSVAAPELARLETRDQALAGTIENVCRRLHDDGGAGRRAFGKIVLLSMAAGVSLLLMAIWGVPWVADRLALVVPAGVEVKLGDAVDGQVRAIFRGAACTREDGKAALTKMVAALVEQDRPQVPIVPAVIDNGIPNAFALPGGRVYVLRGLLDRAETQDEVAGVIAHEIGHVRYRHGLRKLFQAGGTTFLLGLLFGDIVGGTAIVIASQQLLDSSYSRDAEREADDHTAAVMGGLGRSGVAMGRFLGRLDKSDGGNLPVFFRSHPLTAERIARLEKLERPVTGAPILSDAEWQALKAVCKR
jgi:Zn-dependent protease with chaperone function